MSNFPPSSLGRRGDLFDAILNAGPTETEVILNTPMVAGSKDKFSIQLADTGGLLWARDC